MTIMDKFLLFSSAQAVTVTAASTNVVDAGVANRSAGAAEAMFIQLTVGTAFTAAGAATLTVALQDSADDSSFADVQVSAAIPVASLVAGYRLNIPIPPVLRRYTRLNYTVATGPMTAGALTAGITKGFEMNRAYPDNLA